MVGPEFAVEHKTLVYLSAGGIVAGGSHVFVTPIDVIKCRIQVNFKILYCKII